MAEIRSQSGRVTLKKLNEKNEEVKSQSGRVTLKKVGAPKGNEVVEDAIFASSTPVLPGPSYRKPIPAPRVSDLSAKDQGNLLSMDVDAMQNKRDDVDDQIEALEAEKRTWENEKAIWRTASSGGRSGMRQTSRSGTFRVGSTRCRRAPLART